MTVSTSWIVWPGVCAVAMIGIIPAIIGPKPKGRWTPPVIPSASQPTKVVAKPKKAEPIDVTSIMQDVAAMIRRKGALASYDLKMEARNQFYQEQQRKEHAENLRKEQEDLARSQERRMQQEQRWKDQAAAAQAQAQEQARADAQARYLAALERERMAAARERAEYARQQNAIIQQQQEMIEILRRSEPNPQLEDLERNREDAMRRNQEHWDRFTGRR